tara:strand:+ start:2626 stop:3795 length:1170 start_codon:yes stop_codon:yes gene_type:complete
MNIAILGSTGSIGKTTINLVRKNKKKIKIILLSANSNIRSIFNQAKEFNVKNVILPNINNNLFWKKIFKRNKINTYENFNSFNKIFKTKLDYTINAISGIEGLDPTLKIIKHTNKIAIANKESIICGWNLINKELIKSNTKFIPVDSEHFSIFNLIKNQKKENVKKVILTASGGPFLKRKNTTKNIKISDALKHPNWKMGKKISIDSSTLMNKVFEVIEAKKIFNLNLNKIEILINPNSYLHAIVEFNDGIIKMLVHETKMDIPIYNSIYDVSSNINYNTKDLDIKKINKLSLMKPNSKKFSTLNILNLIPDKDSLFETVLITTNDVLVEMFLNKKIEFNQISFYLIKIIKFKLFKKYYKISPKSIKQIMKVKNLTKNFINQYLKNKIK